MCRGYRRYSFFIDDGFFDFTPVQGEILRQLIPRFPETIVNLNHDDSNPEIFIPFRRDDWATAKYRKV